MSEADPTRRQFLLQARAVTAGMVTGALFAPAAAASNELVEKLTSLSAGNAGLHDQAVSECQVTENPPDCLEKYDFSARQKRQMTLMDPFSEEMGFRVVPSLLVDRAEKNKGGENGVQVLKNGSSRKHFTRAEIIGGVLSSLAFGAGHNLTRAGFDTRNISASETLQGFLLWGLQRRLGFAANYISHATSNGLFAYWLK